MFLQINSFCLVTACYMVHVVVLGIPVYKSFGQRSYDQKREMIGEFKSTFISYLVVLEIIAN